MSFSEPGPSGYLTPPASPGGPRLDASSSEEHELLANTPGRDHVLRSPISPSKVVCHNPEPLKNLEYLSGFKATSELNSGSSSSLSDSFRQRPTLGRLHVGSNFNPSGSIRVPDRFLPSRSPLEPAFHIFQSSKDSGKLSNDEKLLRCDIASPDAFRPRRCGASITPSSAPAPAQLIGGAQLGAPTALPLHRDSESPSGERVASLGSIWTVDGLAPPNFGVSNGRGSLISNGTNAPLYTTSFSSAVPKAEEELDRLEGRLAKALELDRTRRILNIVDPNMSQQSPVMKRKFADFEAKTNWTGTQWVTEQSQGILDAPNLRDDFYCSVLAYSPTCHTLAVGLGTMLYAWSEKRGVHLLNGGRINGPHLTSIAFSSTQGCKCILAYGRSDGTLTLVSIYDRPVPRFEFQQPCPIACLTWRPTMTVRPSRSPILPGMLVFTEDLVVGDETGNIYYYSVEWPEAWEVDRTGWSGAVTLIARISIHSQQICGLAWSCDGSVFATGGNDNLCCLFKASTIFQDDPNTKEEVIASIDSLDQSRTAVGRGHIKELLAGAESHRWVHRAAVKAMAFCPWRDGLFATGGGSNDKCIHFFHTTSGSSLATISVDAQVTSLIWSTTRREIAATFGYAQPEHPYRIAVFSWPECKQVVAIPWEGEHRALYAIPYPGGPNDNQSNCEGSKKMSRTAQEGCIVVASSDESVKFHEVWGAGRKTIAGVEGLLGGSDILESMEGIDKEGDIIR